MKVYIARHGLTDWNIARKAQGRSDIPLNETGKKQATKLRDKIQNLDFAICYASPLRRAAETAQIATNGKCEIVYDDRLMERSFSDYEGQTVNGWIEATGYDIGDLKLNTNIGNIEPVKDVLARTKAVLDDIKTKHSGDEIILIVTHGQAARGLHHNIMGYTDDTDWWSIEYGNAEVGEYEL